MPEQQKSPDWAAIRRAYEGRQGTVDKICDDFGVPSRTLYNRAATERWELRQPAVSLGVRRQKGFVTARAVVLDRLYKVLEKQLAAIEARTDTSGEGAAEEGKRDIQSSAAVLRLLERLTELALPEGAKDRRPPAEAKPGEGSDAEQEQDHDDAERLRRDIARRVAEIASGREA